MHEEEVRAEGNKRGEMREGEEGRAPQWATIDPPDSRQITPGAIHYNSLGRQLRVMPEEELFKTETDQQRAAIAESLVAAAEGIEAGTVRLTGAETDQEVSIPETATFETELERLTDSETGEQRYELEYEIRWTQ